MLLSQVTTILLYKTTSANYDQLAQLIMSPADPEHYAKRQ
jgi:hypothetical protein